MKCVDLGADALKRQSQTVAFEEAAWSSVRAREGRRPTTIRDLRNYVRRLLRVEGVARRPLRAMGIQHLMIAYHFSTKEKSPRQKMSEEKKKVIDLSMT